MHEDEERTLGTLKAHPKIIDELIVAANGQVFDTAGDSVLAEFPSVVEAYHCAVAVQRTQCRAARALLNWTQADLSAATGLSAVTIREFENGRDMRLSNQTPLRLAFEKAGVVFIDENGGGAGVRLAKGGKRGEYGSACRAYSTAASRGRPSAASTISPFPG